MPRVLAELNSKTRPENTNGAVRNEGRAAGDFDDG